jgi:hypothetical protein
MTGGNRFRVLCSSECKIMDKIYIVVAHHFEGWSGPDANGHCDVDEDQGTEAIHVGAYTDKERAISIAKDHATTHVVKNIEDTTRDEFGPIDCVSVYAMSVDGDPKPSLDSRVHVFTV